jgi:hypothetical protein
MKQNNLSKITNKKRPFKDWRSLENNTDPSLSNINAAAGPVLEANPLLPYYLNFMIPSCWTRRNILNIAIGNIII